MAGRSRDRTLNAEIDDELGRDSAYGAAGVDYETLDAGKRNALTEALATSPALLSAPGGGRAVDESRGEPAFVFEAGGQTLAFVVEGLGTKSVIARACEDQLGADGFDAVAYDTVAAIVNDLCCVGAVPLVVNAYFATGASDWYSHADRQAGLLAGWRRGCDDAGATWGGGESPSLSGLVGTRRDRVGRQRRRGRPGRRPDPRGRLGRRRRDRARGLQWPARQRRLAGAADRDAAARRLPLRACPAARRSGGRCWSRA